MQIKFTALAVLFLATALSGCCGGGAGGEGGGSLRSTTQPTLPDCHYLQTWTATSTTVTLRRA